MGHKQNGINKLLGFSPPSHRSHVIWGSVTAAPVRSLSSIQQNLARACSNSLLPAAKTSTGGVTPKTQFRASLHFYVGQQLYRATWLSPKMYPYTAKDIGREIINNILQLCNFTRTIWIPFLTFSEKDRYIHCSCLHKKVHCLLPEKAPKNAWKANRGKWPVEISFHNITKKTVGSNWIFLMR